MRNVIVGSTVNLSNGNVKTRCVSWHPEAARILTDSVDKATTDRHARILRDLVKQPDNKNCADCRKNGTSIRPSSLPE